MSLGLALWALVVAASPGTVGAPPPPALQEIGVDERLGERIPLDIPVIDSFGEPGRLADHFREKPVLLVPAYYHCPMLCGLVLQKAASTLRELGWAPGQRFRIVTVSIDTEDTPAEAARKQVPALAAAGLANREEWPFLTTTREGVERLTKALGLRYYRDPRTREIAHPAVVVALTPSGVISRYLHGVDYDVTDQRLALLEASEGRIGSAFEKVLLACYRYDPATRRYGPHLLGFLRVGSVAIFTALAVVLTLFLRRHNRKKVA